ncbi:MAG TPA: choice-of-anchor P family protein [Candidatus Dormibacteraeota bacterium]|nr:choice-of-anchor P family protein [Candidatus Dormibacteraeota bacterium]
MISRRRRRLAIAAASVLLFGLLTGVRAGRAETLGGAAGGESYALLMRGAGGAAGPMAPVAANVPPEVTATRRSGTFACGGSTPPGCPVAGVDVLHLAGDAAVATLDPGGAGACPPAGTAQPDGGPASRLAAPGASACAGVAHVELLRGTPAALIADSVASRSLTQGCGGTAGLGSIGALEVGGTHVIGGGHPLLASSTPPPNQVVVVPQGAQGAAVALTVVLNEQLLEPGAPGLTVNAIHLWTGPALGPALQEEVIVGHSHSAVTCSLEVRHEALPLDTEVAFAQVDPSLHSVAAAVAGGTAPECFGGDRRGGGCHEPVATLVARDRAQLGITANYSDYTHALGAVIVDHRRATPDDPHTTSLCVGDPMPGHRTPVRLARGTDTAGCRTAVSGERLVTDFHVDIDGIEDRGRRGAFWWSVRPFDHTGRTLLGLRADGSLLLAVANGPPGRQGGLTLPEAAAWLTDHGVRDGIALDGGEQADMVLAGGHHPVPPERGAPQVQVALVVGVPAPPPARGRGGGAQTAGVREERVGIAQLRRPDRRPR